MSRSPIPPLAGACLVLAALTIWAWPARAEWKYSVADAQWTNIKSQDVQTEISDNQFGYAVAAHQRGDAQEAERIVQGWLRVYREQRDCQSAFFLLGECRRALGHYDEAYEAYEQLLDGYAGTDLFTHVLGLETGMGQEYLNGRKRKVLGALWVTAYDEGEQMLERVFQRDPRGASGKKALSLLADYHYKQNQFESAQDEYQRLAANFPNDPDTAEFKRLAGQAALGRFRGVSTDARALDEAELQLRRLAQEHPQEAQRRQVGEILRGIDERRAEKDFEVAEHYRRTDKVKAAVYYYRCVVREHPGTVWATQAQARLAELDAQSPAAPPAPPVVTSAGVQAPTTVTGGPSQAAPPEQAAARPGPAVVLWASPAPRVLGLDEIGIIDIGPPIADNPHAMPIQQLGDVAAPTPPTTQPESKP